MKYFIIFILLINLFIPNIGFGTEFIKVTDSTGQHLTLTQEPKRIACLYAFCGHVVSMLDRGKDMVAIVNGLKKDVLLTQLLPNIKGLPMPTSGGSINIESLLKTKPDIVFLKPETAIINAEIKKLERFNLSYFVAGYRNMAEQMAIIEMIGKAIGEYEKAHKYTDYYREIITKVSLRTADIPVNKRVRLYHSVNEPNRTDGPGTIEADWTKASGVTNVSVGASLHGKANKNFASIEQILIWNPEIIIVNEINAKNEFLLRKKWSGIKAVKDKKVYAIPIGVSRWGHPGGLETPLAILWTAKKVYPNLFKDIDLKKEIAQFYKTFFNIVLTKQMIDKILHNKGMRLERL